MGPRRIIALLLAAAALPQEAGGAVRDLQSLWGRLVGDEPADAPQLDLKPLPTDDLEFVPLVLVVGATGKTGRIIVRKLVLQGFRVAVLVRSLSSETLNLLGSGVSYSYGDMTDYRTLLDAMEDVDKVVFAANAEDGDEELQGLGEVMRAFQDTRTFMYGDAEATKFTLLKMRRDADFGRWAVEGGSDEIAERLASAGIGAQPTVAYWKRSPTGAHRNGVFVGKVFDTYLGSAVVGCSLSGLSGLAPAAGAPAEVGAPEMGAPASAVAGGVDLNEYSGLVLRAIGDGNTYTFSVRTAEYAASGLEYQADFVAKTKAFSTVRLPFSDFTAVRDGRLVPDAPELDRRQVTGLSLAFYPQRNDPTRTTGEFYASLSYVKTYRKRDEPEFVYISDAAVGAPPPPPEPAPKPKPAAAPAAMSVEEMFAAGIDAYADEPPPPPPAAAAPPAAAPPATAPPASGLSPADRRRETKRQGEAMLRASGLTYFIMRPGPLDDRPKGSRRLAFTQGSGAAKAAKAGKGAGTVSRADAAEVAVRSLLDPRACNVACTVSESEYAAVADAGTEISKGLEVLQPNRM